MGFMHCTPDSSVRAAGLSVALWRALVAAACLGLVAPAMAADPPVNDAAAVERGARVFQQYCTECHGQDGRAQLDVIADATDLTLPAYYYSGSTNEDIYSSIANGAATTTSLSRLRRHSSSG